MLAVYSLLKRNGGIPVSVMMVEDQVDAGLIKSHRVCRGKNADIAHTGLVRIAVAVTIHRHVVHHIDVDYVFPLSLEIVMDALGRRCH